jgi:hypothetical protein
MPMRTNPTQDATAAGRLTRRPAADDLRAVSVN